ncbi:MAG: F0F1 ATP synthase subunit A [Candidatus Omnitrophica bacterium]|nr:F0F1 ATP synthase subunit A [Candidatus Omnitrophota bacterium]
MNDAGTILTRAFKIPGTNLQFVYNPETLFYTWVVIFAILIFSVLIARTIKRPPSRLFAGFELLYTAFLEMAEDSMGPDGRKFTPLVVTIFLFVLISNWLGVVPGLMSPTQDLNTCLGLGLLVFVIAHASAIAKKGFVKYLKSYLEPFFLFLPINIIGEIGKLVSHSFRLFGNIFAGAIIFALTGPVIIKTFDAIGMPEYAASPFIFGAYLTSQAFFGLFVGTVQALVFALLALTYIAILREA